MKKYVYILFFLFAFGIQYASAQEKTLETPIAECKLLAPNAFTPNGDGVNDYFHMSFSQNCQALKYSLKIFDRWGRLVFEAEDVTDKWDGTYDGQQLKEGVYLWQVALTWNSESVNAKKTESKNGTLVLIR